MPAKTPPDTAQIARRQAADQHLLEKLKAIRALHITSYNSQTNVDQMAAEFYYAIGDILEGQKPSELNLKVIDKAEFLRELENG